MIVGALLLFCNSKIFTNLRFQLYYLPFVYSFNSSVNFSVSKPLFLLSLANSFNFSRSSSSLESLLDPELFCADLKYTSIKMYLLIDYISICKRHLAYLDLMTRACGGSGWTTELARSPWTNQSGGSCHVTLSTNHSSPGRGWARPRRPWRGRGGGTGSRARRCPGTGRSSPAAGSPPARRHPLKYKVVNEIF